MGLIRVGVHTWTSILRWGSRLDTRVLLRGFVLWCCVIWRFSIILLGFTGIAGKPETNALLCQVSSPDAIFAATTELFISCILAATASGFSKNDLEITLLATGPSLDESGWVLRKTVVELAFGIGLVNLLDQQRKIVVDFDNGL